MLGLSCQTLHAEVVYLSQGSTSGYTLTKGNTYVVQESMSFTNSVAGGSGITVEDGATVVLYIPTGVVLTAVGANGSGRIGGGAGICVPSNATLVVTGEGKIVASGGNAGDGANGENGEDGRYGGSYTVYTYPGSGGLGGGGAGAGIGGCGGTGGQPTEGAGENGCDGDPMGEVYILGLISVEATEGCAGGAGEEGGAGSTEANYYKDALVTGGGGGGGAGSSPASAIGGGGSSGGAGGCGKSGGAYEYERGHFPGNSGGGGLSLTQNGAGCTSKGYCYEGGSNGVEGAAGMLYVSPSASVNVERERFVAMTHPSVQYELTFDVNGGTLI